MERTEIKSSPVKLFLLSLLAAAFVALGVFLVFVVANDTDDDWLRVMVVGWASIIFFGFGLIVFLVRLFDRRPRIILDDEGIEDKSLDVGKIIWSDIEAAYPNGVLSSKFISLKVRDADKYLRRTSESKQKLAAYNESLGFETLNLNLVGLQISQKDLLALIETHLSRSTIK